MEEGFRCISSWSGMQETRYSRGFHETKTHNGNESQICGRGPKEAKLFVVSEAQFGSLLVCAMPPAGVISGFLTEDPFFFCVITWSWYRHAPTK